VAEINRAEIGLRNSAIIVTPTEAITACRDADDNKILEAAVAGDADLIVTADKDLRVLSPFRRHRGHHRQWVSAEAGHSQAKVILSPHLMTEG